MVGAAMRFVHRRRRRAQACSAPAPSATCCSAVPEPVSASKVCHRATKWPSTTASTSRSPTSIVTRSTPTCARVRAVPRRRPSDLPAARSATSPAVGLLSGGTPRGEFTGKMIVVQNAHDAACWPNAALSYRRVVERQPRRRARRPLPAVVQRPCRPPACVDQPGRCDRRSRPRASIDYGGSLEQALRDLMALGRGRYRAAGRDRATRSTPTSGSRLAPAAAERGGVQPVVRATANGALTCRRRPWGSRSRSRPTLDAPSGGGTIIARRVGLRRHRRVPVPPRRRRRLARVGPARDDARLRHAGHVLPVRARHRAPRR